MGLLDQLQDYIKANTPRNTRPAVSPAKVFNEGLLNPNQYNAPAANRFKDSAFGLLGVVPGVGDAASAAESADLFNRGEKFAGSMAALGALPMVPAFGGMIAKRGGDVAEALTEAAPAMSKGGLLDAGGDGAKIAKMKTQYELAHEAAQRNAALPVDNGGLGLRPDNTAMDRAKAMGFKNARDLNADALNDNWLHGSPSGDIESFNFGGGQRNYTDNNNVGAVFTTNAPGEADFYAKGGEFSGSINDALNRGQSPTVYPLMISGKYRVNPGKNYVGDGNVANFTSRGSEKEWAVPAQTQQIRSVFAAFDPAKRESSHILAAVAPYVLPAGLAALVAAGLMTPEEALASQADEAKNAKM